MATDHRCDICHVDLTGREYYDANTRLGVWAKMCAGCYRINGVGLGIGKGQRFDATGRCVEGNRKVSKGDKR